MHFRLVTGVWGDKYVENFLKYTARTLLAPGNLPSIGARHTVTYSILSTDQGLRDIRGSVVAFEMMSYVNLELVSIEKEQIDVGKQSHWGPWRWAGNLARANGEVLIFIIPDVVYSDGILSSWVSRFEAGCGCIWTYSPYVISETVQLELNDKVSESTSLIISQAEVVDLALRHLHPILAGLLRDSKRIPIPHPEQIIYALGVKQGILVRMLTSHPYAIDASRYAVDEWFCPISRTDGFWFEECRSISLETLSKSCDWYYRPYSFSSSVVAGLGAWTQDFIRPANEIELKKAYVLSRELTSSAVDLAMKRADYFTTKILLVHRMHQLIDTLMRLGLHRAAALVLAYQRFVPIAQWIQIRKHCTLFIPSNDFFTEQFLGSLLVEGEEEKLQSFFRSRMIFGKLRLTVGDLFRLNDGQNVLISSKSYRCGLFTLYEVEHVSHSNFTELLDDQTGCNRLLIASASKRGEA